ncbi:MAG: tetratricopeptide repeat protein, partial [Candidatus Omnitrophica bacterium]|nr:tetratricopeptide repeat protein [Candidatus Omnitrophota bacterium]
FSAALDNGFTNWDDAKYLTQNKRVQVLTFESVSDLFTRTKIGYHHYVPLTLLSFSIEHHIFGFDPRVFILNNILLHCINVLLVLWFVSLLCKRFDIAFVTAVLFALHPMHVESVAWIVERKDVLYTLFYLGSMISYIYGIKREQNRNSFYAISLLLFLCSLFSKPAAVTLPMVLLLVDFYFHGNFYDLDWKKIFSSLGNKIPFFMLSGLFVFVALGQQKVGLFDIYSRMERVMIGSYGFIYYVVKLFLPLGLSCFYPVPAKVNNSLPILFSIAPAALSVVLCALVFMFRKKGEVLFGLLFYFVTIALVTFIGASTALISDRYTYVPSVGVFLIVSYFVCNLVSKELIKNIAVRFSAKFLIFCFFVMLAIMTFDRCKVWKNGITLWSDVISKYDDVPTAYVNRGNEYGMNKEYDLALADYNKALELEPRNLVALTSRGYLFYLMGKYNRAIDDLTRAVSVYPQYVPAYLNRSLSYERIGEYRAAIDDLIKARTIEPDVSLERINDLMNKIK